MDSNLPPDETGSSTPGATPPPPIYRPPPVIAPAPRPERKGSGWKVFAIVLLLLLLLSFTFNLFHAASSVVALKAGGDHSAGPRLEEVLVKDMKGDSKIAVLNITGVITGQAVDGNGYSIVSIIKEQLNRAKRDEGVKAVVLKVDSPGGEVLASDEIYKAIMEFQKNSKKPVVASMGSLAASGGYYVSSPCEWIVANELTITGSIGVIMEGFNYRGLLDKVGVRPEVFKSGKFKDMLSPVKTPEEISQEEKDMVQHLVDETFGQFKRVVQEGRHASFSNNHQQGKALSADWANYADGRILSGKEAYNLGFVDDLGDFDVAVKRAEILAGLKDRANLIQYQPVFDLSNLFRMLGESHAKPVKVDLGVEIPQLRAGYLYFLSPTYVR